MHWWLLNSSQIAPLEGAVPAINFDAKLSKQIDAGADIIQLFESWSSLLEEDLYNDFIILERNSKYTKRK